MSRNILNQQGIQELIRRAMKLTATTKCLWGTMTVDEMLYHCNLTNKEILNSKPYEKKTKFKQRFLKFIVMNIWGKLPKGAKINSKFLKPDQQELNFELEKAAYIETISRFANYSNPIYGKHPVFGRLKTYEWRHFVWMHMDHHLRQFGV